jgi:iron complex transport system substrate-binding protein
VVSLTCSNTEIVCALGRAEDLVGVDDHSDFPPEVVARLPRVGPDLQIDVAKVAALKPDLVLASLTVPGHEKVVEAIAAAGLTWIAPDPESLDDVYRDVRDVAARLGVPERGEALVAEMQAALVRVEAAERPSVLVEWWPKPVIVPGRRSWVTDLVALAGGRNPFGERDVLSTPVTDEEVVAADPDAVVICWCGVPFARYRPDVVTRREAWAGVRALREGQVHCIPEAYLGRPGPRLVDGYRALRAVIERGSGYRPPTR